MTIKNISAVIICGGKSQRMGNLTKYKPKTLLEINNKPIIWYIIMELYRNGVRNFFFTLGYKGEKIKSYIDKNFRKLNDANFYFIKTGINSTIAKRIDLIIQHKCLNEDLLLLNSDTIFRLNLKKIFNEYKNSNKLAKLIAIGIQSKFGLILKNKNSVKQFTRNQNVNIFSNSKKQNIEGYIYSGISFIKKISFNGFKLLSAKDFEINFFNYLIKKNLLLCHHTSSLCLAADTPKDIVELKKNNIVKVIKNDLIKKYKI